MSHGACCVWSRAGGLAPLFLGMMRTELKQFYDVIVLGASVPALFASALLAKRDFRVLVLGQGYRPQYYDFNGLRLARRSFHLHIHRSPIWAKTQAELAQTQLMNRKLFPVSPPFQAISKNHLFVPPPYEELSSKLKPIHLPVEQERLRHFYRGLFEFNLAFDSFLNAKPSLDLQRLFSPFFLKRKLSKWFSPQVMALAHDAKSEAQKKDDDDIFSDTLLATVAFASNQMAHSLNDLPLSVLLRQHSFFLRDPARVHGGEEALISYLAGKIISFGGDVQLDESCVKLELGKKSGNLTTHSIHTLKQDQHVGAAHVLSTLDRTTLFSLTDKPLSQAAAKRENVHRYVMSLSVKKEGIPFFLAAFSIFVPSHKNKKNNVYLSVVDESDTLSSQVEGDSKKERCLLIAETFLEQRDLPFARELIWEILCERLPFLERHVELIDSVYDGRPLWDFRGHGFEKSDIRVNYKEIDRDYFIRKYGDSKTEVMSPCVHLTGVGSDLWSECLGEPFRTPIKNVFLIGASVAPGLGQEGELFSAIYAADVITKADPVREQMRKDMWKSMEIG